MKNNCLVVGILILLLITIFILFKSVTQEVASNSFERGQKCELYRHEITKKLLNDTNETGYMHQSVDDIWYSPSKNTCFYSMIVEFEFFATENRAAEPKKTLYYINDYSNEIKSEGFTSLDSFLIKKNQLKK